MSEWVINKIGLINFWYYDEEEFEFSDGRLLLRGSNGSGKSVTMQSFIPLLLDGNRSAKRLDPFGTNSRKIENYLLMDGDNRDENTGYLYMEFVKPQSGNYLTIGIGLRAHRGKPVEFWGFSITDGKRIGKDFLLYKEMSDKILLTKRELKNRILDNGIGEFCERASDYKAMVNNYIFGFNDVAEYEQLIDLLVQLRSPKLSKDYKPTVLYEIMEESLKPLSDEDLRPMSKAIENMDNIEASIAGLKAAYDSANRLRTVYDKYNSGVLYYKGEAFINALNSLHNLQKNVSELTAALAGISEDDRELYIKRDGSYGISIIKGFIGGKRPSRYIGAESRRRHKEEVLKQLSSEFDALEDEYNRLGEELKALMRELELMHDEYKNAPSTEDITAVLSILKDLHISEENGADKLERLKDEASKAFAKLNERQMTLDNECEQFDLPKSIKAYRDAADYMENYRSSLNIMITVYKDMCICKSNVKNLSEKIEELGYQIDDLFVDIRDIKLSLNKAKNEKENCEEIKRRSGFDNIELELEAMQRELEEIPDKLRKSHRLIDRSEINNDNNRKTLETLNIRLAEAEAECDYCERVFSEELALRYNNIKTDNLKKAAEPDGHRTRGSLK